MVHALSGQWPFGKSKLDLKHSSLRRVRSSNLKLASWCAELVPYSLESALRTRPNSPIFSCLVTRRLDIKYRSITLGSLASHTHEPRDVPLCGALRMLQKPLHHKGGQQNSCMELAWCVRRTILLQGFEVFSLSRIYTN
jgi:hypothetical protein